MARRPAHITANVVLNGHLVGVVGRQSAGAVPTIGPKRFGPMSLFTIESMGMVGPEDILRSLILSAFSWSKIRNLSVWFRVVPLSTWSCPISLAYARPREVLN